MSALGDVGLWPVLGWTANVCYFSRFLLQWIASERASRSVAPRAFWWLSLLGVVCFTLYSDHKGEPVLVAGGIVNGLIYARNLMLAYGRAGFRMGRVWTTSLAIVALWFVLRGSAETRPGLADAPIWLGCSIIGQLIWSSRFVLQWWCAERAHRTQFPPSFWWISLVGNTLLLAYTIHLKDAVLIAGFALGPIVQIRNLMLLYRRNPPSEAMEGGGTGAPA